MASTPCTGNGVCRVLLLGEADRLWQYQEVASDRAYDIGAPSFEVDGKARVCQLGDLRSLGPPATLSNGVTEHRFVGPLAGDPDLSLELVFRIGPGSPVVRFRYVLHTAAAHGLTKTSGKNQLTYLSTSFSDLSDVMEVRLSEFNEVVHSYTLAERTVAPHDFENELHLMGPILVGQGSSHAALVAYEHGATAPDHYLHFALSPDRKVALQATKGNYFHGQPLDPEHPYETIWFQFAAVPGSQEALARAYRSFVLRHLSLNEESRKPYIFYNTWNFQERNRHWNGRPYLESMNQDRMLQEIDVAHRLGIEVFVVDTGWYSKTGDWEVSRERFPNGLAPIKQKLDSYGMKLGLWFDPTVAAVSSKLLQDHRDCITTWRGQPSGPRPIWETEESHHMCLVSRYGDAFADKLIHLHHEVGVSYFKWDAVGQYGCDDPNHKHGGPENSEDERADCYAFRLGLAMAGIVDRVCQACPEAMVDFDITESGRYVGLGFLAASKYYLVNNGPYYRDYNLPVPPDQNWNMFFYPGPARGWICRTPLTYDKWIPSVLFMTHYLTDDPESSQVINIASLILGQNGMWGDLPQVSEEGVKLFGHLLGLYKQVREDITESYPVRSGAVGGTPEVHEKISERTGRGAVAIFTSQRGRYIYITSNQVTETWWHADGVQVTLDERGRARIEASFEEPGAKLVFFGAG